MTGESKLLEQIAGLTATLVNNLSDPFTSDAIRVAYLL